jgi:subtilisin family serine protease
LEPGVHDRFYDSMVINQWRTVVKSAGNRGAAGCDAGTDGDVTSPGLGYNVITVGNFDDRNTFVWNDDVMAPCSSWRNPKSTRGDRQKPEVAAPGENINSTTISSPWTGDIGSGTSYAAPMVTGTVALLLQANSGLTEWPEAIKAILMTSALHNVEGSTRLSEYDGAGGIDASWAYYLARRTSGSNWGAQEYSCSSATDPDVTSMSLSSGKQFRATIAWDNDPNYSNYKSQPSADLDLQVIGPSGTVVANSSSYDNTYEIVDFTPSVSGTYKLRVKKYRCDYNPKYLGWAWQVWQQ